MGWDENIHRQTKGDRMRVWSLIRTPSCAVLLAQTTYHMILDSLHYRIQASAWGFAQKEVTTRFKIPIVDNNDIPYNYTILRFIDSGV